METYEYYIKKANSFITANNKRNSLCIDYPSRLCHALKYKSCLLSFTFTLRDSNYLQLIYTIHNYLKYAFKIFF